MAFQAGHRDQTDLIGQHLCGDGRVFDGGAGQRDLLRLGLAEAQDTHFDGGAWIAVQQDFGESQRHVASGDTVDGFENIGGSETSFGGRRTRDGIHHADVSEFL